jgi:hypothetical protein
MTQAEASSERKARMSRDRAWMPTVAGILDICAGGSSLIGSAVLAFLAVAARSVPNGVSEPIPEWPFEMGFAMFFGLATLLLVLGVLAVIGGAHSLRGAVGLWPIVGAIAATLSCPPLGVPAIVLTVMSEHGPPSGGSVGTDGAGQRRG